MHVMNLVCIWFAMIAIVCSVISFIDGLYRSASLSFAACLIMVGCVNV